jgi:hypothetical protein
MDFQLPPQFSKTAQAIRQLRAAGYFRAWSALFLSGNRNSATTGLGLITQNGVDIFQASVTTSTTLNLKQGQNPYNNWLGNDSKPLNRFFPLAGGVYVGQMGDTATEDWGAVIAEHTQLIVSEKGGGNIVVQPTITVPSGLGLSKGVMDSSGLGPFFWSRSGPLDAANVFEFPDNTVFSMDKSYSAVLSATPAAATALAAAAGAFPTQGAVIGVCMYGIVEWNVGAQR